MRKYVYLIIVLLLISCKSYKIKNVYFKSETLSLDAKITRIDSTGNDYVYFLKNDTLQAFFTKKKECNDAFKKAIDTTINYNLTIKTDATYNYYSKSRDITYFLDRTSETFKYDDYRLILLDSPDICGQTVNCKENLVFKEKFFSSIKFIDTLIYSIQGRKFKEALLFISKHTHVSAESMSNYAGVYPEVAYKKDRKIWLDWYEKNKCTNIQFKE